MASIVNWDVRATRVLVQPGGAGYNWRVWDQTDVNSATVDAISGGGQDVESRWARDTESGFGSFTPIALVKTGNPSLYTGTLRKRLKTPQQEVGVNAIRQLLGCMFGLRIDAGCGEWTRLTNYLSFQHYSYGAITSDDLDQPIAQGTVQDQPDIMISLPFSAVNKITGNTLTHNIVSDNVTDVTINRVIALGVVKCADGCSPSNDGNQDFAFITNADASPGHGGASAPRIFITDNGATTWPYSATIDDATGAAAHGIDLISFAGYLYGVVPGASSPGVFYALISSIKANPTGNVFAPMTGINNTYAPSAGKAIGAKLYFGGLAGGIWESTDGVSLTLLSAGTVTSQQINSVDFADEQLGWFGGNSGALVRYFKGALSLITISGLTGNITRVRVPKQRGDEIYVFTSTGQAWRSRNGSATTPTWSQLAFDGSGTGSISAAEFDRRSGRGEYLYFVHTRADGSSRVIRDMSGGAMGLADTEIIGTFDSPVNIGINDIAPSDPNTAITVGNAYNSVGFIGKIS